MSELQRDIAARRTFAIISHPDAGKTTMTEKLLLLGQAIQVAGSVKGKKGASCHVGLDGVGTGTGHLCDVLGHAISLPQSMGQPA